MFLLHTFYGDAERGAPNGDSCKLTKKIYVGNLSFQATEDDVRDLFSQYGAVSSVAMITDRETGRFRGFCFVEMDDSSANEAISALDGKEVDGRALRVNEARPREERSGGAGGGFRSGGGTGGGFRSGGTGGGQRRDNFGGGQRRDNFGGGQRRNDNRRNDRYDRRDYGDD